MTLTSSASIYAQLFDNDVEKDYEYFKKFNSLPVERNVLLEILKTNTLSTNSLESKLHIIKDILNHSVNSLSELIDFPEDIFLKNDNLSVEKWNYTNGNNSVSSSFSGKLDIDGEDITTLHEATFGNLYKKIPIDIDGDDITTLHATIKKSVSDTTPTADIAETENKISENKRIEIGNDTPDSDLISNIIKILHVWFQNIYESNRYLYKKKNSLGKETTIDLLVDLFSTDIDSSQYIKNFTVLLSQLKWYLSSCLININNSETTEISTLPVIRDIIYLLAEILKSICWSLGVHSSTSNEFVITRSLLFTFYSVDFFNIFDDVFQMTSYKFANEKVLFPKLRLSPETLITLFNIVSVLSSMPNDFMPENFDNDPSLNGFIISESSNTYDMYMRNKEFNFDSYSEQISSRILPFFAIDFGYYYKFKADLMTNKESSSSFMRWITGSMFIDDPYAAYKTAEKVTSINENYKNLSIIKRKDDPFLIDFERIYESRIKSSKEYNDSLETFDFLPITFALRNFCKNASFKRIFLNEDKNKDSSHDLLPNEDEKIHLFEIWLCLLSYNYQYHHSSKYLQTVAKVSLLLILELITDTDTPSSIDLISNYEINEFKWKLCHQKLPLIPNCVNKQGYKSGIFYILDVIQILLRFNLTKKLEVENFRLSISIAYKIIEYLHVNFDRTDIGNYAWSDFFKTIINLLAFIKKQNLVNYKYFLEQDNAESIKTLNEELLLLINLLLSSKFAGILCNDIYSSESRSITYDLIYELYYNWEVLDELMNDNNFYNLKNLDNISICLNMYQSAFCRKNTNEVDQTIQELDFDSPLLVKSVLECVALLEEKPPHDSFDRTSLTSSMTYSWLNGELTTKYLSSSNMVKIFNIIFSSGYKIL